MRKVVNLPTEVLESQAQPREKRIGLSYYPHQSTVLHLSDEAVKRGRLISFVAGGLRKRVTPMPKERQVDVLAMHWIIRGVTGGAGIECVDESHVLKTADPESDSAFVHPEYNRLEGDIEE